MKEIFIRILVKVGRRLPSGFIRSFKLDSLFERLTAALLRNKKGIYDINLNYKHKIKMALDLSVPGQRILYLSGLYEPAITRLFCKLVEQGCTVIDVGAYVGYYTALASKLVGETGRIFSFEPAPWNFSKLQETIEANKFENVTLYQAAVGDRSGKTYLWLSSDPATHSIAEATGRFFQKKNCRQAGKTVEVDVISVDQIIGQNELPIDNLVVKIDAEGAELKVLKGMKEAIANSINLHLICSVHEQKFSAFGYTPNAFFNYLRKHKLDLYLIGKELIPIKASPLKLQQYEIYARKRKQEMS